MKAVVEWGNPKEFTKRKICGISSQFTAENPQQARFLAVHLFHTLVSGVEHIVDNKSAWGVSKAEPRKVIWASDNSAWVCVTLLDGVARGAYAGIADAEAKRRIEAAKIAGK
jgi:hypothetical protein